MLHSFTTNHNDLSTDAGFQFEFFCDCCGRAIPSTALDFHSGFRRKLFLTAEEREARAIIYADHHSKAYERANNEVLHELNRCERCGDMVCEDCTVYNETDDGGVICRKCSEAGAEGTEDR